ncbi:GGDEF domain-containing protein [Salibacterium lacus]|uniref:GGDEF domain-containing protein n=1 Tax=Salibacterium lacus TaxID=1898109 RepID=A0ABW5T4J1_9BACI
MQKSHSFLKEIMNFSMSFVQSSMVALTDANGNLLSANDVFLDIVYGSKNDLMSANITNILRQDVPWWNQVISNVKQNGLWFDYIYLKDKNEQKVETFFQMSDYSEDRDIYMILLTPIQTFHECEELQRLVYIDELTGVPNLRSFRELLAEKMKQSKSKIGILFIDIDNFKKINDQFGHVVGDSLLQKCAEIVVNACKGKGKVFRKSGDEFLMIIDQTMDIDAVKDSIDLQFSKEVMVGHQSFMVDISMGYSVYPDDGEAEEDLLRFADMAMYKEKNRNKLNRDE